MSARRIDTAEVAKLIRADLKRVYGGFKFSVRISRYAGGSSIRVEWRDGPTAKEVESLIGRYKGSSFDGMIDLKSYHDSELNGEMVHFGSDHVFCTRDYSPAFLAQIVATVAAYWGIEPIPAIQTSAYDGAGSVADPNMRVKNAGDEYLTTLVYRECCITSALPAKEEAPAIPETTSKPKPAGKITATYDNGSWLITGDTFMRRREIKAAGARWDADRKAWAINGELPDSIKELCGMVEPNTAEPEPTKPAEILMRYSAYLYRKSEGDSVVDQFLLTPDNSVRYFGDPESAHKAAQAAHPGERYLILGKDILDGGLLRYSEEFKPEVKPARVARTEVMTIDKPDFWTVVPAAQLRLPEPTIPQPTIEVIEAETADAAHTERADPLEALALAQAEQSFQADFYAVMDRETRIIEGLALMLSHYFKWSGVDIMKVAALALEDANFHSESSAIDDMIAQANGY